MMAARLAAAGDAGAPACNSTAPAILHERATQQVRPMHSPACVFVQSGMQQACGDCIEASARLKLHVLPCLNAGGWITEAPPEAAGPSTIPCGLLFRVARVVDVSCIHRAAAGAHCLVRSQPRAPCAHCAASCSVYPSRVAAVAPAAAGMHRCAALPPCVRCDLLALTRQKCTGHYILW
jgi:hypothetical protein